MTKKKIAWVTDSTAYITKDLLDHPDVYVLPLAIIFDGEAFDDGIDLSTDELYERIRTNKEIPKTSQPAAGRFAELYEKLSEEYESAVAIHISSKLSGTLDSSASGRDMAGFDVQIVDSFSMSYAITTLIYKGMKLAEKEQSAKEIRETLQAESKRSENYILLGSLDQFYKGGRMSGTQFLIGNILKIKPIIRITKNGEFELFQKVRSEKKATNRMLELLQQALEKNRIEQVQIMHGNDLHRANEIKEMINIQFPKLDTFVGEISSSIAVHAGEGTTVLIWSNEEK
ncbi:fatty acid-binding protein DegV [Salipaludibacillus neizhouensis]|uniref:Fatty acid-binding protein DegV n=1 Tax=Salipaludibacillus neizhouensis TaxID=885475 RepID=A0A3A9K5Y9_9BACI|nr:DegV family protein [Salipaludibacillus neizhouensis]RKL66818.1 fatty acid-binding protein DegV [Salipaludibacillus neizhouensis]